jgi:hypothetical protein
VVALFQMTTPQCIDGMCTFTSASLGQYLNLAPKLQAISNSELYKIVAKGSKAGTYNATIRDAGRRIQRAWLLFYATAVPT